MSRARSRVPALAASVLLTAAALAGCLATEADGDAPRPSARDLDAGWAERALPHGDGHDHHDPEQHRGLGTPNFRVLGWDPLVTAYHGASAGGYLCGDVAETGERRIAFVHSFSSDVAYVAADVTDPTAPFAVGELVLPWTHVYDIAVTPDARYVVLATSPDDTGPDGGLPGLLRAAAPPVAAVAGEDALRPVFRDRCGVERPAAVALPEALPYASGVVLVDVADPAAPVILDYHPLPVFGAHSVTVADVDGRTLVLASVTNLVHAASPFHFFEVVETPAGAVLAHLSAYRPPPETDPSRLPIVNGHMDGIIAPHPVTGATLAWLADWDGGIAIVDVTEPRLPMLVGRWSDYAFGDSGDDSGSVHGTFPLAVTWDDRHYTFVGQEILQHPTAQPTGNVFILDTTDPASPELVGRWTLPVDVVWGGLLMFSTHYFTVVDRTLFVSLYHGGVWAVDVSDVTAPRTVGVFLPEGESPAPPVVPGYRWAPTVLDVVAMADGDLVVWDATSGVYVVRFDATDPAPAPEG